MKFIAPLLSTCIFILSSCQYTPPPPSPPTEIPVENKLIFKDSLGHTIMANDLENVSGDYDYELTDNKNIDPKAKQLHDDARQLGSEAKYDEAISKLQEAIKIQPDWAYPYYDLAYTYLLDKDEVNALKYYKKTDEMEPKGFFTAKTAVYTLEGEKSGKFHKGMYVEYMMIEWTDEAAKKIEIAKTITKETPDFAPAWKELGCLLEDNTERLNAIETGLAKNPDEDTKGILLINKAAVLNLQGQTDDAKKILGELIFSPETTSANVELAKFSLKSMTK